MARFTTRFTIILLTLFSATVASAQSGDWYVAPSIIYNNDAAYRAIDDSLSGFQVTAGRNMTDHLSLEGLLSYSDISAEDCAPGDCFPDQKHTEFSANLLAYYDRDSTFAPYLLAGVGYLNVNADAEAGIPFTRESGETAAVASLGLGLKWRLGQSNFSIRVEHRLRSAFDDENLTDQVTAIGLQYNFGRTKPAISNPAPNKDTDGDGVLDIWDACENTPPGVDVTARGCEIKDFNHDDDKDRVNNSTDECPNTPPGVPVDRRGCSLDSDGDGVTTDKDRCPASRTGADVNIYGCENDNDNDGVVDHRDKCLFTKPNVRVDVEGCEIKDIISLPGVNFESGKDILLSGTEYLLQTAADTLNANPDLVIEVAGHTDNVGNSDLNIGLSMRRAKTVRDFLIQFGVDEGRLSFRGYGEAEPIADNSTAEGRATNRRVELRLDTR